MRPESLPEVARLRPFNLSASGSITEDMGITLQVCVSELPGLIREVPVRHVRRSSAQCAVPVVVLKRR